MPRWPATFFLKMALPLLLTTSACSEAAGPATAGVGPGGVGTGNAGVGGNAAMTGGALTGGTLTGGALTGGTLTGGTLTGGVVDGSSTTAGGSTTGAAVPTDPVIAHKPIHRLSNIEYDNTMSHLLGTEVSKGESFINEEAEGFDNIAAALSMSPRQAEDYFVAARDLSANVFDDATLRARVVPCDPVVDATCAQTVITNFGKRAFRRPLEAAESELFFAKYQEAIGLGLDPLGALEHVVHIMLASPQFLYRIEFDPDLSDTTPHALSSYELASRLSYALWSSMPDDALFAQADSGAISQQETLLIEVDRMLADERSSMLAENFAAQWFGSRRLSHHAASVNTYPTWNAQLAASMQTEMELFFSHFLDGDLSYADFLTTDINFVDATLAAHYGMAAPAAGGFQQVVDTSDQRAGFLGLAGFLTHTSRETRSSPIIRGTWILKSVWCLELKLPTDLVVEPLPEDAEGATPTTLREQIAAHRTDAVCAGCHNVIDPIGLALENFDGIGRYRAMYESGLAIDPVTTMPEGEVVDGLASLSTVLAEHPEYLACAVNKFGTYSMGLPMPRVNRDQITAKWAAGVPTLKNLLKETVQHEMFRMRSAEGL